MATAHATTSIGGEILVYVGLLVILGSLLLSVHALLVGLSPTAIANNSAEIPPLAWVGLLAGFLGGGFLAAVGSVLSFCS